MMSDLEKYKTELCAHYEEKGSCPLGINCKFAHGQLELRSRLSNKIHLYMESSKFQKPHENSSSYMPKMKTVECKFFRKYGNCKYERSCHFAHGESDLKTTKSIDTILKKAKESLNLRENLFENNNENETDFKKNLYNIKKIVEKGSITEASNKLFELYNKINIYDEDKILRINNFNNKPNEFEIITKQSKDLDEDSMLLNDNMSCDQILSKRERIKILETEIKVSNYQKNKKNEFSKIYI